MDNTNRKIFECKITLEGIYLPTELIANSLVEDGCEVVEVPIEFDKRGVCTKAELMVYRVIRRG